MKTIFLASTLFFSMALHGQEIPPDTLIKDLPSSLAIVVKKEIKQRATHDGEGWFFYHYSYFEKLDAHRGFDVGCKHPQLLKENAIFPTLLYVSKVRPFSLPMRSGDYSFKANTITFYFSSDEISEKEECRLEINAWEEPMPLTIEAALKYVDGYIGFVDSDPYANLDDQTAQKIIMKKITVAIESGSYKESLPYFSMLERREKDLPEEFYYYYAKSLRMAGEMKKASAYATKYLGKYGESGKYYERIIELMAEL